MSFLPPELPVLRVSQAIGVCNSLLAELPLAVEGEVSQFSVNQGKFVFFDLKDEEGEGCLPCFMMLHQLGQPLEDGMRVVINGRAKIHEKSGRFRVMVSRVEAKGEGSLKRAFQLLMAKLEKEGLFAAERKRALPRYPRQVGVISSADAAGFGDFMKIARERLPGVAFTLVHVAVQGAEAEAEICAAFDWLNGRPGLDAIVLIRGGGSIEDLHAFNSEPVARAIVRSKAPVVVGVGHERDVTIADYCADLRAATPSNAAQLLLPTRDEVLARVRRLTYEGELRIGRAIQQGRQSVAATLERSQSTLRYACRSGRERALRVVERSEGALAQSLVRYGDRVEALLKTIVAVSPEETLKRGYSLTWLDGGALLTKAADVPSGAQITTQLADGRLTSITK